LFVDGYIYKNESNIKIHGQAIFYSQKHF